VRVLLKGKIHKAKVSDVNIDYEASTAIDRRPMEAADILPFGQVHVLNINNGARFVTYAIEDEEASSFIPRLVYVDTDDTVTETRGVTGRIAI